MPYTAGDRQRRLWLASRLSATNPFFRGIATPQQSEKGGNGYQDPALAYPDRGDRPAGRSLVGLAKTDPEEARCFRDGDRSPAFQVGQGQSRLAFNPHLLGLLSRGNVRSPDP